MKYIIESINVLPIAVVIRCLFWLDKKADTSIYDPESLEKLKDPLFRAKIEKEQKERLNETHLSNINECCNN
jgi:hypothetical protein